MELRFSLLVGVTFLATIPAVKLSAAPPDARNSISETLNDAYEKRSQRLFEADREYRLAVASTFRHADRVEVFLLDYGADADANEDRDSVNAGFSIPPLSREVRIFQNATVPAQAITGWCDAVTKTLASEKRPRGGFGCYAPIHGIRIYAADVLLFETAICWKCHNYFCDYGAFNAQLETFTEDASDLRGLFNDTLPITDEIKARLTPPKSEF